MNPWNGRRRHGRQPWLEVGLRDRDPHTVDKCRTLAESHIVPAIGAARLRDLSADDLDDWLGSKVAELATSTLREVLSILRRSITLAQRRDLVVRNVAELVTAPKGTAGRPSKALRMDQADAVLDAAHGPGCTPTSSCRCSPVSAPRRRGH